MRPLIPIVVSLLLVAGCGDDDADTGSSQPPTATEARPDGPIGELSERGIGSVAAGASADEVSGAFGAPDREREGPGCELAGPNARPVLQWTWDLDDGAVTLDFDASERTLTSYRSTSPSLPTTAGIRVGDRFAALRDAYGPLLKGLPLGAKPTPRAGFWYVGKPAARWQLFDVRGGVVRTIQGGDVQICE